LSFTNQQLYDRASIWTLLPGLSNQKVILLHSTADSEVSFSQATKLEGILKIAGKNVALTPLPNDDHVLGLQSSATTVCTTTFQALGIVPVDKCAF
jgi:hypothetical protein